MKTVPMFPVDETATSNGYPIRPGDIQLDGEKTGQRTFGKTEIESAAGRLVMFFRSRGLWCAFTEEELRRFYQENDWPADWDAEDPEAWGMFYGLFGTYYREDPTGAPRWTKHEPLEHYVCLGQDGRYRITNHFIEHCAGMVETPFDWAHARA